ncbi:MAG: hypothetical protein EHM38_08795 [Geobacteraceae bacterium]|nr:MAG: hypothetical protein EHM38_08795 [Geobacteraceae bacterium]
MSELPKIVTEIVEYQRHTLKCSVCGTHNRAEWPQEMPTGSFGERLQGLIGYLSGRFGVSQRDMVEMLETVFQVDISLGSIPAQEQRVSQALKQPVEAAQKHVQTQKAVNLDETGWHEFTKNVWLWVCSTPSVTVFRIFQVRGGESAVIGRLLLACLKRFFGFWHRLRAGILSRSDFQTLMQPIRAEVGGLLDIGTFLDHRETRRTCRNILKVEPALWTFVDREGVEPSNNAAERALRRGVIWRRRSYGTQSQNGSLFVERILTAVMTLRQQKQDVLDYLADACKAATLGKPAPSLLPAV